MEEGSECQEPREDPQAVEGPERNECVQTRRIDQAQRRDKTASGNGPHEKVHVEETEPERNERPDSLLVDVPDPEEEEEVADIHAEVGVVRVERRVRKRIRPRGHVFQAARIPPSEAVQIPSANVGVVRLAAVEGARDEAGSLADRHVTPGQNGHRNPCHERFGPPPHPKPPRRDLDEPGTEANQ